MPLTNNMCLGILGVNLGSKLASWTIGVILSAIAYGGLLSLTLSYVSLLLKTSYDISRRRRIFLLVYVIFMLANSTVYISIMITTLMTSFKLSGSSSGSNNDCSTSLNKMNYFQDAEAGGVCIALAMWGADGFMVSKISKTP